MLLVLGFLKKNIIFSSTNLLERFFMQLVIWISRIFVGVLFIFSGFIKANDALGFSYKLEEYFEKFASIFNEHSLGFLAPPMEWMAHIALPLAIVIVVFEMVLGVLTLIGAFMPKVSKYLLIMIVFFTFLTFVSWYFEIVKTCGCFGEAIPLTPFQSFIKDLILLSMIVVLFTFRKNITSLCTSNGDKISLWSSTVICTLFTLYCYQHLPVLDFRAYAPGSSIKKGMEIEKGNPLTMYKLKNKGNGIVISFADFPADYPANWDWIEPEIVDGELTLIEIKVKATGQVTKVLAVPNEFKEEWEVVSTSTENFVPDKDAKIQQLHAFYYKDRETDYIQMMLDHPDHYFWLVIRDFSDLGEFKQADDGLHFMPNSAGKSFAKHLNKLYKDAKRSSVKLHALTGEASYEKIESFKHSLALGFEFYDCDDTELKTMIRSSPGLLLLKADTVVAKWHNNDFDTFEEINNQYINK